jgi:DMSO/TMAO reductase YedYZ molybdopterin-dependent catalytic subunit
MTLSFRTDAAALGLLALGAAELAAVARGSSIVDRVGRIAVDTTPLPVVEETIRFLGTTDKPLVRASALAGAAALAGLAGGRLRPGRSSGRTALTAGTAGLAAYLAGRRRLDARREAQDVSRRPVTVIDPLPPATDGAESWVGVEPLFTDPGRFYTTDVNLRPPLVDRAAWRLDVETPDGSGAVSLRELHGLDLRERDALLVCVHNRLGWDRLGHQRWTGAPVADVVAAAGFELPDDLAGHDLVSEAVDGYRHVMPLSEVVEREAWVVVGMGGQELPAKNGFPARVMTPGVVGQYNGVKWLSRLAIVPHRSVVATWVGRGWPRETVVPPPMARIDHPGNVGMPPRLPQGTIEVGTRPTLAGTAWAPAHGGVAAVEIRLDGGRWEPAEMAADLGAWSWRRWRAHLDLSLGQHEVAVRCLTHDGAIQDGNPRPPFPHGATGHHTLRLRACS